MVVLAVVGAIRLRLLDMPLERDEGEYAYVGQLILQGIPPYQLAYTMKLPGTGLAYALGMAIFGQTDAGIHALLLMVNAATIVFVFLLGRSLAGERAAVVAAAAYGVLSTSTAVLGLAAHATQFVILFAVAGTWLLWRAYATETSRRVGLTAFLSGLFYGLAFLMKQPGAVYILFGGAVLLARERKLFTWVIGAYGAGAILPVAITVLVMAWAGVFPAFWFWTFAYAHAYATGLPLAEGLGYLRDYLAGNAGIYGGFWILALIGLWLGWRDAAHRRITGFLLGFLVVSFLGTTPGLYFREHYFVLWLPALALAAGQGVELLATRNLKLVRYGAALLATVALAGAVWTQRQPFFRIPARLLTQIIYPGNPVAESIAVAQYLNAHSAPTDRIAVLGSEPQIYFHARRHSATGFIYMYPLMEHQPYATTMQHQMAAEIESARPEFIVMVQNRYSWLANHESDLGIFDWSKQYLAGNYERVGIVTADSAIWGGPARSYAGPLEQCLIVYRRKS
jgi:hypothetical protein